MQATYSVMRTETTMKKLALALAATVAVGAFATNAEAGGWGRHGGGWGGHGGGWGHHGGWGGHRWGGGGWGGHRWGGGWGGHRHYGWGGGWGAGLAGAAIGG